MLKYRSGAVSVGSRAGTLWLSRAGRGQGTAELGSQPDWPALFAAMAESCSGFVLQITHPWAELSGAILTHAAHSCLWGLCSRSRRHVPVPCTMEHTRGLPNCNG